MYSVRETAYFFNCFLVSKAIIGGKRMRKFLVLALGAMLICSAPVFAGGKVHWGYSGHGGPEEWGKLSSDYAVCGSGKNQSPINLTGMIEADLEPIKFNYRNVTLSVENNGHTIKVDYPEGSSIQIDGKTFNLLQFHFHTPSENQIEGRSFPMEAHLVHSDKDGSLAVVAVMFEKGGANPVISAIWDHMPQKAEEKVADSSVTIDVNKMMPVKRDYYRFNGSLTTPPCTEGVRWLVLKNSVPASAEQFGKYGKTMHGDTNRPVQPVNARPVLK